MKHPEAIAGLISEDIGSNNGLIYEGDLGGWMPVKELVAQNPSVTYEKMQRWTLEGELAVRFPESHERYPQRHIEFYPDASVRIADLERTGLLQKPEPVQHMPDQSDEEFPEVKVGPGPNEGKERDDFEQAYAERAEMDQIEKEARAGRGVQRQAEKSCERCNKPLDAGDAHYYADRNYYGRCASCQELEDSRVPRDMRRSNGGFMGDRS